MKTIVVLTPSEEPLIFVAKNAKHLKDLLSDFDGQGYIVKTKEI